jgi:adenosylmethionine-8-amino-7-oxononanoate aminotransferase
MPPYCVSESQLERMVLALRMGVQEAAAGPALQES